MDLTRLYNLTTPELREEAERLGVGDTYAMSRGQLIHAIRNPAGRQESEGFLGKVVGFAKWALQAAQEEPRKEAASRPPRGEAPAAASEASEHPRGEAPAEASEQGEGKRFGRPSDAPLPSVGRGSASVPVPASVPVSVPVPASASASVSVSAPARATDHGVAMNRTESEPELEASSGPPGRPPAGVFSKTARMFDEPFPTLTMARILAEQGHFKRSLAIYAILLRDQPGNRELSAEADGIRAQSRARRPQVH
ncbi:MAG: hypothetical protein WBB42_16625 [Polyangiales bacterium]